MDSLSKLFRGLSRSEMLIRMLGDFDSSCSFGGGACSSILEKGEVLFDLI